MDGIKEGTMDQAPRDAAPETSSLATSISSFFTNDKLSMTTVLDGIVSEIHKEGNKGLRDLVDLLGEHLTSSNPAIRTKGMSVLCWTIVTLRDSSFSNSSSAFKFEPELVSTLAEFFLERLDDRVSMTESLEALTALISTGLLSRRLCESIARRLYCDINIHVQSLPQPTRRATYLVLKSLIEDEKGEGQKALKAMKEQIIYGYIQAMDGEKEPRNLLIALLIFPKLTMLISEHVQYEEDLFEITSCYFPVTFSEKADDPNAIKKQSLINALRRTMVTSTEHWIPFLLEKLASTLIETKLEVLESLRDGLTFIIGSENNNNQAGVSTSNYSQPLLSSSSIEKSFRSIHLESNGCVMWRFDQISSHFNEIASALVKEIMNTTDTHVADISLQVLSELVRFITKTSRNGSLMSEPSKQSRNQALFEMINPLLNNCVKYFGGDRPGSSNLPSHSTSFELADSKLTSMASKIIQALVAGSEEAARITLKRIMPILEHKYLQDSNSTDRASTIRHLLNITKACQFLKGVEQVDSQVSKDQQIEISHPLHPFSLDITRIMQSVCLSTTSYPQEKSDALECLSALSSLDNGRLLSVESNSQIIQIACQMTVGSVDLSYLEQESIDIPSATEESGRAEVQRSAVICLSKISNYHPTLVINHGLSYIFEKLQSLLSHVIEKKSDGSNGKVWEKIVQLFASLHALCDPDSINQALSHQEDLKDKTIIEIYDTWKEEESTRRKNGDQIGEVSKFIQNRFFDILRENFQVSRLSSIILSSLSRTCGDMNQFKQIWSIVVDHFDVLDHEKCNVLRNWLPILVQHVNSFLNTSMASKSDNYSQEMFLKDMCRVFIDGKLELFMLDAHKTHRKVEKFAPFEDASLPDSSVQRCLIPTLSALICNSPFHMLISKDDQNLQALQTQENDQQASLVHQLIRLLQFLFDDMISYIQMSSNESNKSSDMKSVFESVVDALCSILNKIHFKSALMDSFIEEKIMKQFLGHCSTLFEKYKHEAGPESEKQAENLISALFWISKALIQRNHSSTPEISRYLMNLLSLEYASDAIRRLVALKFEILFLDSPTKLPKTALLYKQKLWTSYMPLIESVHIQKSSEKEPEEQSKKVLKSSLILAFSGLIKHLPHGVLVQSLGSMLPMWLDALGKEGEEMRESAVITLDSLLSLPQILPIIESHLHSIVPSLLSISSSGSPKSEHTCSCESRLAAVSCLNHLLELPFSKLYPFRNTIVDGLSHVLDDRKRVIRKAAVQTRNRWFLIRSGAK